jgi:HTH-type transcriptional regulator / antitoxin MqsA
MLTSDRTCTLCGKGVLTRRIKAVTYRLHEYETIIEQPGDWCDYCDDGILTGEDIMVTEPLIEKFRADVRTKKETDAQFVVAHSRKRLKLTQREAARIFGGGPNAFSLYERGKAKPPKSTLLLLKLLDQHPELLKEVV